MNITTKVVSSNLDHGEVYSIQHTSVRWVFPDTPVSSTNKTDRHNVANILLKVALNIINQTIPDFLLIFTVDSMNQKHMIGTFIKQELKTSNLHLYPIYMLQNVRQVMVIML